jgi:DNA-binding MarR family transcriptional regulator
MVSMPTITSVVDGLVARGLVEREPEPSDRRRVRLNLTPAGRRLYEDYRKTVEHRLSQVLSRLTEEQQRRLLLALNDLEQVLDTPPDKEKLI